MTDCWFNRFHTIEPQCPNMGTWRTSPELLALCEAKGFMGAVRWCDAHRHEYDVPVLPCFVT